MLNNLHLVSAGLSVGVSKEFLHGHVIVNFAAVLLLSMINIFLLQTPALKGDELMRATRPCTTVRNSDDKAIPL